MKKKRYSGFGKKGNPIAQLAKLNPIVKCPTVMQVAKWQDRDKCTECNTIMEPKVDTVYREDGTKFVCKYCTACGEPFEQNKKIC